MNINKGELIKITSNDIINYIPIFNNLGYFISKYTMDGQHWLIYKNEDTIKPIALFLEAKFDQLINPVPSKLYHITLDIYVDKILKIGLIPRSKSKISNHPDRIYLSDSIKEIIPFGEYILSEYNLRIKDNIKTKIAKNFNIFEIDTKCFNRQDENGFVMKLYKDVNFPDNGFYTLNNISPEFLKLII